MENPSTRQITRKQWLRWLVPVGLLVLVTVLPFFPVWIERVYAQHIYPVFSITQRFITGWLPFSLGDLLYFILGVWLAYKLVNTLIVIVRRKVTRKATVRRVMRLARLLMWVYVVFNLVWGLNYHRLGLRYQLEIPAAKYSSSDINVLMGEVVQRLNETRRQLSADTLLPAPDFSAMRQGAVTAYRQAADRFPFLGYSQVSVKKSIYSGWARYLGFTGYYNPFSGEAQLRTQIPEVMKPFILCHEIGHQLGYAKEDEASFAGYLAAANSTDPYFRYSVYLDLYVSLRSKFIYTKLAERDTVIAPTLIAFNQQLDTLVRYDRRKIREYFQRVQTKGSEQMSGIVLGMYAQYLKANNQSAGLQSYDDVISLLLDYRRKYGRI